MQTLPDPILIRISKRAFYNFISQDYCRSKFNYTTIDTAQWSCSCFIHSPEQFVMLHCDKFIPKVKLYANVAIE